MENKYGIAFSDAAITRNTTRLTNQLWKLIPMRENDEDWKKQISTVIIEIAGLKEIFMNEVKYLQVLSKLEGLQVQETSFEFYRKTVFEIISLMLHND